MEFWDGDYVRQLPYVWYYDGVKAPKATAYTFWSCHSGITNPVRIVSTPPVPSNGGPITVFGRLPMFLIKVDDVETNPGLTTSRKQVWICDICHRQIPVRKHIDKVQQD